MSTGIVVGNDPIRNFACYDNDVAMKNSLFVNVVKKRDEFKEALRAGNEAITAVARKALKTLSEGIDTSDVFIYVNRTMDSFASRDVGVITDKQEAAVQKVTSEFHKAVKDLFESENGKALFDQHAAYSVAYKKRIAELVSCHFKHQEKEEAVNSNPPRTLMSITLKNILEATIEAIVASVKKEVTPLIEPLNLNKETKNYVGDYKIRCVAKQIFYDNASSIFLKQGIVLKPLG